MPALPVCYALPACILNLHACVLYLHACPHCLRVMPYLHAYLTCMHACLTCMHASSTCTCSATVAAPLTVSTRAPEHEARPSHVYLHLSRHNPLPSLITAQLRCPLHLVWQRALVDLSLDELVSLFSLLCSLRSYFGNHSDAAGFHYHPSFASGYDLLEVLLQLQPEIMDQMMENFLEGKPFKTGCVMQETVLTGVGVDQFCVWGVYGTAGIKEGHGSVVWGLCGGGGGRAKSAVTY